MASFSNPKLRKAYEETVVKASAEDLALLMALTRPLLKTALERVAQLADTQNVVLDPLPLKPSKADDAED